MRMPEMVPPRVSRFPTVGQKGTKKLGTILQSTPSEPKNDCTCVTNSRGEIMKYITKMADFLKT